MNKKSMVLEYLYIPEILKIDLMSVSQRKFILRNRKAPPLLRPTLFS